MELKSERLKEIDREVHMVRGRSHYRFNGNSNQLSSSDCKKKGKCK